MRVVAINPLTDRRWDQFVHGHPQATIYHFSDWAKILIHTFAYVPFYLALADDSGALVAGIPFMVISSWLTGKRLVSLPRTPHTDPLVSSRAQEDQLLAHARQLVEQQRLDYLELRVTSRREEAQPGDQWYAPFWRHTLPLAQGEESLWKRISSDARRHIKRAREQGLTMRAGNSEADLDTFWRLYRQSARKNAFPCRPRRFFQALWHVYGPRQQALLSIAESHGQPVAATLNLRHGDTLSGEFLGQDPRYCDSHTLSFLVWDSVCQGIRAGCRQLDMGVCAQVNDGLRQFKHQWRGEESQVYYWFYPDARGYKQWVRAKPSKPEKPRFVAAVLEQAKSLVATSLYRHFG